MPRVKYYCAASLDGYIAALGDDLDWLLGYKPAAARDEDGAADPMSEGGSYERFYEGVGALVSGSVTYEWILEHLDEWPYAGKPYWVLSSRGDLPKPPGAEDEVHVVEAPVGEIHDEVAAAAGERNVWIVGGGPVASQYADAGLLDDVLLTVVPVVLGAGKPMFAEPPPQPLRLVGTTAYANGMVELRYEVGDGRAANGA